MASFHKGLDFIYGYKGVLLPKVKLYIRSILQRRKDRGTYLRQIRQVTDWITYTSHHLIAVALVCDIRDGQRDPRVILALQ